MSYTLEEIMTFVLYTTDDILKLEYSQLAKLYVAVEIKEEKACVQST